MPLNYNAISLVEAITVIDFFNSLEALSDENFKQALQPIQDMEKYIVALMQEEKIQWEEAYNQLVLAFKSGENIKRAGERYIVTGKTLMAGKMSNALVTLPRLDMENIQAIFNFYMEHEFDNEIKGTALYSISLLLRELDPLNSFEISIEAFKLYPNVAKEFNSVYLYRPDEIRVEYFDCCPICGAKDAKPYYNSPQALTVQDNSLFMPSKLWMKCKECENIYSYNFPVMNMGEINGKYVKASQNNVIAPKNPLRIYSDIFNRCKEFTGGNKYLEIGIGNGEMMAVALEMGYDVKAVEISKESCEVISEALNVDVVWADFLQYQDDNKYDIIIMGDVIEHAKDPLKMIIMAKKLLNIGGLLWISTPNFDSAFTRLMKFQDPMWNQRNHFTYFSYKGIERLINNIGMQIKRYDISNRYNGSMELYIQTKD